MLTSAAEGRKRTGSLRVEIMGNMKLTYRHYFNQQRYLGKVKWEEWINYIFKTALSACLYSKQCILF